MGEEVRITDYDIGGTGKDDDDDPVFEWEHGLPNGDDLTPLSQMLISSELLSAFNITPEPYRSMIDVNRASQNTLADLSQPPLTRFKTTTSFTQVDETEAADLPPSGSCSGSRKLQRTGDGDGDVDVIVTGAEAVDETETHMQEDDPSARVMKRQRLVWTPQLHKRFIEVVAHLGVKNAVPKTIMQLMNVEGLTRENVASHLQKYRLYLKRMQGSGDPNTDHLFGSNPVPQNLGGNGYRPVPYVPQMAHQMQYQGPNSEFRSNSYTCSVRPNRK